LTIHKVKKNPCGSMRIFQISLEKFICLLKYLHCILVQIRYCITAGVK